MQDEKAPKVSKNANSLNKMSISGHSEFNILTILEFQRVNGVECCLVQISCPSVVFALSESVLVHMLQKKKWP